MPLIEVEMKFEIILRLASRVTLLSCLFLMSPRLLRSDQGCCPPVTTKTLLNFSGHLLHRQNNATLQSPHGCE